MGRLNQLKTKKMCIHIFKNGKRDKYNQTAIVSDNYFTLPFLNESIEPDAISYNLMIKYYKCTLLNSA